MKALEKSFEKAIEKSTKGKNKAAVPFSGGVDSALIAKAVSEKIEDTVLFCAGTENSQAIRFAEKAADIDIDRARSAMERAKERLAKERTNEDIDFRRAEAALGRAVVRIRVAENVL